MRGFLQIKSHLGRYKDDCVGATAVEAALCMPIVIAMMFACFQYGMFFFTSANVAQTMDESYRDIVLLEAPTSHEISAILTANLAKHSNTNIVHTVSLSNQFGRTFATINAQYDHAMSIPFLTDLSFTRRYRNMVMLSADHDSNT